MVADACLCHCQVAAEASDLESYFCSQLRLMPLGNIDPSLAIGFYCRSLGEPHCLWWCEQSFTCVPEVCRQACAAAQHTLTEQGVLPCRRLPGSM